MIEFLAILLVLVPIVILGMAVVAFLRTSRLQKQIGQLETLVQSRLEDIENRFAAGDGAPEPDSGETAEAAPELAPESEEEPAPPDEQPADAAAESEDTAETSPDDDLEQQEAAARSGPWASVAEPTTPKSSVDLESLVGGRWSVLLGGLALALGIIFLVRTSIEAGYLGPGPRVILGIVASLLLLAAGEWLRRSDRDFALPVYAKADVPGILTGAGVCGLFAALYAAHALYGFIGPGIAFIVLTAIGIGAMFLSAIHGPKLAAIGVLGAYGTPLLVSSDNPNTVALALHVVVVTGVVLALAHIREWRWLAIAGFAFSTAWIVLAALGGANAGVAGLMMLVGIGILFACLFYVREDPAITDHKTEKTAILAFALLTFALFFQLAVNNELPGTVAALAVSLLITGIAVMRTSIAPLAVSGTVAALLGILESDLQFSIADGLIQTSDILAGTVPRDIAGYVRNAAMIAIPATALGIWGTRRAALDAPRASGWLASAASALLFFALVFAYLRISPFETKPLMGAVSLGVAAILAVLTETFIRMTPGDNKAPAPAAFAVGAIACAAFAISISLEKGWFPLAFSLTALGIVAVYLKRPVRTLPWLAVAATVITGVVIFANMPGEMPKVSATPIFNELILLLGVPAAALLVAGELLRRAEDEAPLVTSTILTASGLALAGLFVGLEITHFINDGNLATARQSLAETAGHTLAALGFAIGLQRLAGVVGNPLLDKASLVAGILSVILAGFGLLILYNPAFNLSPVGPGTIFNLLLPGYLLTGLGAAVVALLSRAKRPRWYTLMYAALSGLLLFTYCSLMLRKSFQGQLLDINRPTSDLEFWLYSPLWLVLGALLLAVGLKLKSLPVRAASAMLIGLTVFKVFLLDMASLEGILRALSFIGLGICLIVIGRFYQRILTRQAADPNND